MNSDFRSIDALIFHRHGAEGGQGIPLEHRLYSRERSINAEVVISFRVHRAVAVGLDAYKRVFFDMSHRVVEYDLLF